MFHIRQRNILAVAHTVTFILLTMVESKKILKISTTSIFNQFMIKSKIFSRKAVKLLKDKYFPENSLSNSIGKIDNEIKVLRELKHDKILKYYEYFVEYIPEAEMLSVAIVTDYCQASLRYLFFCAILSVL